jgi:CHAT domain-containing protein/Tfp pilus assembly protein PilF
MPLIRRQPPPPPGLRRRRWWLALALALPLLHAAGCGRPVPAEPENESYNRGQAAFQAGDNQAAADWFRRSIEESPLDVRAYRDLIDAHLRLGTLDQAEAYLLERQAKDPKNACLSYALGKLEFRRNRLREALARAETAVRLDRELGWGYLLLGLIQYSSGRPQEALGAYEKARKIFRRRHDTGSEALALNNSAGVLLDLNEQERALAAFQEVLARQRALGRREAEIIALGNIGLTQIELGDYRPAVGTLREGLALARALKDGSAEWRLREYLSYAHRYAGDYPAAVAEADSIIRVAGSARDRLGRVAGGLQLASLLVDLADPAKALAAAGPALVLADSIGHARYRADLLRIQADARLMLGEIDQARGGYLRSDSLARAAGLGETALRAQASLCRIALQAGDSLAARAIGDRALRYGEEVSSKAGVALISSQLAGLYRGSGDGRHALALSDRAVELSRQAASRIDQARALAQRARVRLSLGDLPGARTDAEEGRGLSLQMQSPETLWECEDVLGDVARTSDRREALGHLEKAMEAVEGIRRNLLLEEHRAGYREDRMLIYAKAAEILVEEGAPDRAFEICERSRARTLQDLLPSPASPGGAAPGAGAGEIASRLAEGEALLEYLVGPRTSLCFVLRQGRVRAVPLPIAAADLLHEIDSLRAPLTAPRSLSTLSLDARRVCALREKVLDPVLPYLEGARTVYLVPDGPLHFWPFEAFPLAWNEGGEEGDLYASFRRTEFWGDQVSVIVLPSARLLAAPPRALPPGSAGPPRRNLLAFGLAPEQAAREARSLEGLFPDAVVRTGAEATEASFKALAPGFRLIHVSSHATADEALPFHSGLALAPDAAGTEDGFLHAYEILSLPLHCDLVTLSACETGCGRLYAGEGVLGLTSAFLSTGARQVLVSLWSVNDTSTSLLMRRFYAHLGEGMSAAAALGEAKRELRQEVLERPGFRRLSYAHPFFWAPFVLVGLPDRPAG